MQNLTVYNILKRTTAAKAQNKNSKYHKEWYYFTSMQHIAEMSLCCEEISSFVIFAVLVLRLCYRHPYKML